MRTSSSVLNADDSELERDPAPPMMLSMTSMPVDVCVSSKYAALMRLAPPSMSHTCPHDRRRYVSRLV